MKKYLLPVLLASVISGLSFAQSLQPGDSLSLAAALEKGLANNFDIRISLENVRIAQNNNTWGMAGLFPSLSLSLSQNNSLVDAVSTADSDERETSSTHQLSPGVGLQWTLFDGFAVHITKRQLNSLNDLADGNAALIVENTVQGIVLAYYEAALQRESLKIMEKMVNLSKDRYNSMKERKSLGSTTTYDALQSKIAYLEDESDYIRQQSNYKTTIRSLMLIMGEPSDRDLVPTDSFQVVLKNYKLSDLLSKMKTNNRTLQNQYINQEILKQSTALSQSSLYPSLSLSSGYGQSKSATDFGDMFSADPRYNYYVNFSLSLNLSNGGRVRRAISEAKIEEKIGEIEILEMQQTLENTLRTQYELFEVHKKLLDVAEEQLTSAQLNLDISADKYKSGAINSFNYRDVQLLYLNAALGRLQAIYDLIDSQTEIERLTGGILTETVQ